MKKKYAKEKTYKSKSDHTTVEHFPGVSKRDIATRKELTDILNTIPEHKQTETIHTDLACYKFVRDLFIKEIKNISHKTLKIDREHISAEERIAFNEVLILALTYHFEKSKDAKIYTKKELSKEFNISEGGFKIYDCMIHLLEKNKDFGNNLRNGFKDKKIIPDGSPTQGFEFALQGAKLLVQRKVSSIDLTIKKNSKGYQDDIHTLLDQ